MSQKVCVRLLLQRPCCCYVVVLLFVVIVGVDNVIDNVVVVNDGRGIAISYKPF